MRSPSGRFQSVMRYVSAQTSEEHVVGGKRAARPYVTIARQSGAGGIAVEIHHDTALRGLPIGRPEAMEMLDEIRISRLLSGFRGKPPANREALADVILGVAACALAHQEIDELEANPVFAYEDRAVVVDARAFLKQLVGPIRTLGDSSGDESIVA